jgi:hypothetical protein
VRRPTDDLEVDIEILSGVPAPQRPDRPPSGARDAESLPPPPTEDTALDLPISVVEDLPLDDHPARSLPRPRRRRAQRADPDPDRPPRAPLSGRDVVAIALAVAAIVEAIALALLSR